jgi:putative transcriptional regulator
MLDKSKLSSVERDLVAGLEGLVADLKSGEPIEKKYTCHRVVLDLERQPYTPDRVRATRRLLNASQELFAQFLGVSVKAVRKWESGHPPSDMACRFMEEIRRDPAYWRRRWQESLRVKDAG